MSGHAETLDIANSASGIKGCDAVFPYDSTAAYGGMRDWALLLLAENQRLRDALEWYADSPASEIRKRAVEALAGEDA